MQCFLISGIKIFMGVHLQVDMLEIVNQPPGGHGIFSLEALDETEAWGTMLGSTFRSMGNPPQLGMVSAD